MTGQRKYESEIIWEEPPAPDRGRRMYGRRQRSWPSILRQLQTRPGEWARVTVCNSQSSAGSTADGIRNSAWPSLQGSILEAVARHVDGEFRVYARYIGPEDPS